MGAVGGCARRTPPGVVLPERGEQATPTGRDRGDIEIALGAVTTAVATTLVVLGAVAAAKAAHIRSYCADDGTGPITEFPSPEREATCTDPLGLDPFKTAAVSAGLSFAFAVPIAAGGGVLLRKGVKMRRAYMQLQKLEKHQVLLRPWFGGPPGGGARGGGAGLSLSLRF